MPRKTNGLNIERARNCKVWLTLWNNCFDNWWVDVQALTSMREEMVNNREHRVAGDIPPELTLTLPTPAFDCSVEFINFGVEALRRQTYGDFSRSSCDLRAGVVDIEEAQDLSAPPLVHSCCPDNGALQTYDLDSMNTLSHLDLVASTGDSVDANASELDRSRNHTPPVICPASQNGIGRARHPSSDTDAPVLDDSATRQLGNRFSRFRRYLLRRVKLFSLSGNRHRTSSSNGKELWSVKRATRVFSIHSDQLPKSRESTALDNPNEEDLKKKQAVDKAKKLARHSLISFVRRTGPWHDAGYCGLHV